MNYYCTLENGTYVVWIGTRTKRVFGASGPTVEVAWGRLMYALSQRDDPKAKPRVRLVEVK